MLWQGDELEFSEIYQCFLYAPPTHLFRGTQVNADRRALRLAEQRAAVVGSELEASHTCRLAIRHTGDGRGDRRRNTTCTTTDTAIHKGEV